jgi:hypothetical protein
MRFDGQRDRRFTSPHASPRRAGRFRNWNSLGIEMGASERPMDLAETIRKMVLAASAAREITIDTFKDLTPADMSADDIERLIDMLNAQGIWVVDE